MAWALSGQLYTCSSHPEMKRPLHFSKQYEFLPRITVISSGRYAPQPRATFGVEHYNGKSLAKITRCWPERAADLCSLAQVRLTSSADGKRCGSIYQTGGASRHRAAVDDAGGSACAGESSASINAHLDRLSRRGCGRDVRQPSPCRASQPHASPAVHRCGQRHDTSVRLSHTLRPS
jgi:hypothetical protein